MKVPTRDKLRRLGLDDQEMIRFLENLGTQSGVTEWGRITGTITAQGDLVSYVGGAISAHVALADPHPQYLTGAEGNAAYAPIVHTHTPAQVTGFDEAVDDRVAGLLVAGSNVTLVYNDVVGTLTISAAGGAGSDSFETVNKNLAASDGVISYSGGDISTIAYANGITKTFAYGPDGLSSVTLSGSTPGGIDLVKTLNYTLGELTGFTYS